MLMIVKLNLIALNSYRYLFNTPRHTHIPSHIHLFQYERPRKLLQIDHVDTQTADTLEEAPGNFPFLSFNMKVCLLWKIDENRYHSLSVHKWMWTMRSVCQRMVLKWDTLTNIEFRFVFDLHINTYHDIDIRYLIASSTLGTLFTNMVCSPPVSIRLSLSLSPFQVSDWLTLLRVFAWISSAQIRKCWPRSLKRFSVDVRVQPQWLARVLAHF